MPSRRHDPADGAAENAPDTYASIWSELSEAQRAAILAAIGSTETDPVAPEVSAGVRETMQALNRVLIEEPLPPRPAGGRPSAAAAHAGSDASAPWGWRPEDNGLVAANVDPGLIVGGNTPSRGTLVCQRVTVAPQTTIRSVLLEVVSGGTDLSTGRANLAAVYEADGTRSGVTDDQAQAWARGGLHRMALVHEIAPEHEARNVWVAFIADGGALPGFAVPWISRAARPNLALPSPGPQRAGEIPGQTTCPESIAPAAMQPGEQYWVGLA